MILYYDVIMWGIAYFAPILELVITNLSHATTIGGAFYCVCYLRKTIKNYV